MHTEFAGIAHGTGNGTPIASCKHWNPFAPRIPTMTVASLVSKATPPLKPTDSVEYALGLLMEARVRHLPVVDGDRRLLGVIS